MTEHLRIVIYRREAARIAAELTLEGIPFNLDVRPFDCHHFTVAAEHGTRLDALCDDVAPFHTMVATRNQVIVLMRRVVQIYSSLQPDAPDNIDIASFNLAQGDVWHWYDAECYPPIAAHDPEWAYTVTCSDDDGNQEVVSFNCVHRGEGWLFSTVLIDNDGILVGLQYEDVGPHDSLVVAIRAALDEAVQYALENDYPYLELNERLTDSQIRPGDEWTRRVPNAGGIGSYYLTSHEPRSDRH